MLSLVTVLPRIMLGAEAPVDGLALGQRLPTMSILPFALLLLAIALLPLLANHFWEHNRNKAIVSAVVGVPMVLYIGWLDYHAVLHTLHEYVAFIILLGALFIISGGVLVRGTLAGTAPVNTGILALGAVLASFIGTTGASMLLIRPLLRANSARKNVQHIVIFFIFIVSNAGGLLTPLGDPPLFLGFLRGVPFFWTMRLWVEWATVNAVLLIVFHMIDSVLFHREDLTTPGDLDKEVEEHRVPLSVAGKRNLLFLAGVIVTIVLCGHLQPPVGVQEAGMLLMAGLSLWLTPNDVRTENNFSWGPIVEVAVVFAGIFATMIPALAILNARGNELGLTSPAQFFWATGALSSFLDNAPTYLTFAAIASGIAHTDANNLSQLVVTPSGEALLTAISAGAVFMGANTYIGNGPNFMVKAVAESAGVKMPSFFGYMAWSGLILLPTFALVTVVFFR